LPVHPGQAGGACVDDLVVGNAWRHATFRRGGSAEEIALTDSTAQVFGDPGLGQGLDAFDHHAKVKRPRNLDDGGDDPADAAEVSRSATKLLSSLSSSAGICPRYPKKGIAGPEIIERQAAAQQPRFGDGVLLHDALQGVCPDIEDVEGHLEFLPQIRVKSTFHRGPVHWPGLAPPSGKFLRRR